jgi:hypothetical protein
VGFHGKYLKGLNNWTVTYFKRGELTNIFSYCYMFSDYTEFGLITEFTGSLELIKTDSYNSATSSHTVGSVFTRNSFLACVQWLLSLLAGIYLTALLVVASCPYGP